MTQRGKGEGSIFQRKDGVWTAKITVGYNPLGKRIRKSVYGKTKGVVTNKLTRLQNQKLDGTLLDDSKLTVGEYLDRWLADSVKLSTAPSTHASYKSHVELYLKPIIGMVKLAKLAPSHIAGLYSTMDENGNSARMRGMVHATIHRALRIAVKWGLVIRNVSDAVDRPKSPKVEICPLSVEQVQKLLVAAEDDRLEALFVLAIAAGMRSGELLGLHWADVDLKGGKLSVRRTLIELGGEMSFGQPKSSKGKRLIVLPDVAVQSLKLHKAHMMQEGQASNPLVFFDESGNAIRRTDLRRLSWLPLLTRAGLPTFRFHDLRHTSATLLLSAGIHPKIVQERLGHSTISLTLDTYSHVTSTLQQDASDKMNAVMKKVGG